MPAHPGGPYHTGGLIVGSAHRGSGREGRGGAGREGEEREGEGEEQGGEERERSRGWRREVCDLTQLKNLRAFAAAAVQSAKPKGQCTQEGTWGHKVKSALRYFSLTFVHNYNNYSVHNYACGWVSKVKQHERSNGPP